MVSGLAAAGTALVGFGVNAVNSYHDGVQAAIAFQRASGATMEQSSALVAAFDDVGISAETGAKAIFQLGKRAQSSADDFAEYGIDIARSADGTTDLAQTLLEVSDAYNQTADPAERAALLTAAFGKSGQDLIPILERGRAGIEDMFASAAEAGQIFDDEDREKSERFKAAVDDLSDAFHEFSLAAGEALLPLLADVADVIASVTQKVGGLVGAFKDAGDLEVFGIGLDTIAKHGINAVAPIAGVFNSIKSLVGSSSEGEKKVTTFGTALERLGVSAQRFTSDSEAAADELEALHDQLFSVTGAQRAYDQAQRSVADAQRRQVDAQRALNELLAEGRFDFAAIERATRAAADASKEKTRADNELAEAQQEVLDVKKDLDELFSGRPAEEARTEAREDEARAELRLRSSKLGLARAQQRMTEVATDSTSSYLDLQDAQLAVDQATQDLRDSEISLAEAQERTNEAGRIGFENSQPVIDKRAELKTAEEKLAEALDRVTDAQQNVIDKQAELVTATAGDPAFDEKVRKARQDVAAATQSVADASFNVSEKYADLKTKSDALQTGLDGNKTAADQLHTQLVDAADDPKLARWLQPAIDQLHLFNSTAKKQPGIGPPPNLAGAATNIGGAVLSGGGWQRILEAGQNLGPAAGGLNIQINTLDPAAAGPAVIAAIKQWEQRNGIAWRSN